MEEDFYRSKKENERLKESEANQNSDADKRKNEKLNKEEL